MTNRSVASNTSPLPFNNEPSRSYVVCDKESGAQGGGDISFSVGIKYPEKRNLLEPTSNNPAVRRSP
jgi:hypothetical protein